ncbi:carboxylate-amine ligase [Pleurocapsales cyanobacterium LEGE 06147]|nr:carboxylate-amine ligase [Pleurocapsales cyanobacterium LEGE 06147]
MDTSENFTLGVEEEYQIIDPQTHQLCGRASQIIKSASKILGEDIVQPELYSSQIEIATSVCQDLAEVRQELIRCRRTVIEAAKREGRVIGAAGIHPFSDWKQQQVTPKSRYQKLKQEFQQLISEMVIFGCHVHVGLQDRSLAIEVINRARIWLSVLLALAANSPFWLGQHTGYASYRTELWNRLPLTGPPLVFNDYEEYDNLVKALIATNVIEDATKIYWDIRLSEKFPTIEFRVADVCLTVEETVAIAGLIRGLARTCYQEAIHNTPFVAVRHELLRSAHWCAARYGLAGNLIDVIKERPVPAKDLVHQFLDYIHPALNEFGDWDEISSLVERILKQGNGAQRQMAVYQKTGSYDEVIEAIVAQTAQEVISSPLE